MSNKRPAAAPKHHKTHTPEALLNMLKYAQENPYCTYADLAAAIGYGTSRMISYWMIKAKQEPKSAYGKIATALKDVGYVGSRSGPKAASLSESIDMAVAMFRSTCECGQLKDRAEDEACLACLHTDSARQEIMRDKNHSLRERSYILTGKDASGRQ